MERVMKRDEIYTSYMYSYPHKTAYGNIEVSRSEIQERLFSEAFHLYMHIPFCETKCGYCNLFSVTGVQEDYVSRYLEAMKKQAEQLGLFENKVSWRSLTIGGGTPLLLRERQLDELLQLAERIGALNTWSCIETSPNQTSGEKVAILKAGGLNRVSIGVQSFIDQELQTLGRHHDARAVKAALEILKGADFQCLNLDLIYGIPGQTGESVRYSLARAMAYEPEELFVYPLYIRDGTKLYGRAQVRHEEAYRFYHLIRDGLLSHGYHQISMRRFVKERTAPSGGCGFESTLSLGCGGRSYIGGVHCCTPYAVTRADCLKLLDDYLVKADKCAMDFGYRLDEEELKRRYVIKNLLHTDGIGEAEYETLFGAAKGALTQEFPLLGKLAAAGDCAVENGRYRLTPEGMSLSDFIGPKFVSQAVHERMAQWRREI